jgi:addiction module HigA family antidote
MTTTYQGQHNPPHPGEFIDEVYLKPFGLSRNDVARRLDVSPSTFSRLVNGKSDISPEMAIRLSRVLGRSPRSWMAMQDNYDLNRAAHQVDVSALKAVNFAA